MSKGFIPTSKSSIKSFTKPKNIVSEKEHGFTLIELIVVIIIVGILAAIGISQYSNLVEKSRLAEAKIRIGAMRQLAYEYYMENQDMTNIRYADVGVDYTCSASSFYKYWVNSTSTFVNLIAERCTDGGKAPYGTRPYRYALMFYPSTGQGNWSCVYLDDVSPCGSWAH